MQPIDELINKLHELRSECVMARPQAPALSARQQRRAYLDDKFRNPKRALAGNKHG